MPKQSYWIRDVEGVYAQVEGAETRDEWTQVRGWSEEGEPGPTDQVHVVNENPEIGGGQLPYGAVESWAGLGWKPGPPPGGNQSTPAAEPAKPTKNPAVAGEQKEK